MDTYNPIESAVTYESGKFISDEETSDKELFDVSYVIKNILVLGAVTLFVASAKTYKTTLMAIIANLISSGAHDFIGNLIQMVRILYLTNEAPKVARKRFRAVKRYLGIDPSVQNIIFYGGKSFLITPENISKLCEELKAMGDLMPRLVIIDPIASMFSGDMSDSTAALAFRSCLDQFTGLNMAVLCGHHFNKKITEILDMDAIFGSQVFQSGFDSAFALLKERKVDPANKKQLIYTGNIILKSLYQKDSEPIQPVTLKREIIQMPFVDKDGDHPTAPFLLPYGCQLTSSRPDLIAD